MNQKKVYVWVASTRAYLGEARAATPRFERNHERRHRVKAGKEWKASAGSGENAEAVLARPSSGVFPDKRRERRRHDEGAKWQVSVKTAGLPKGRWGFPVNTLATVDTTVDIDEVRRLSEDLESIGDSLADLERPVDDVVSALAEVERVLGFPDELKHDLDEIGNAATAIATGLEVISGPLEELGIGEVLDLIGAVLDDVRPVLKTLDGLVGKVKEITDPLKKTVAGVEKPLKKLDNGLKATSGALATYAPATRMIAEVFDIAVALDEAGGGTHEDELAKSAKIVNEDAKGIRIALDEIDELLRTVDAALRAAESGLDEAKTALAHAEVAASRARKVLRPLKKIGNEVRKIENAIKPVKWALDLVSWLARKVLGPVIKLIEKVIGPRIEKLVSRLVGIKDLESAAEQLKASLSAKIAGKIEQDFGHLIGAIDEKAGQIERRLASFTDLGSQTRIESLLLRLEEESRLREGRSASL